MLFLISIVHFFINGKNYFLFKWTAVLLTLILGYAFHVYKKTTLSLAVGFFYFGGYAALFGNSFFQEDLKQFYVVSLSGSALQALVILLLFPVLITVNVEGFFLPIICLGSIALTLLHQYPIGNLPMNAAFIAFTLPFLLTPQNMVIVLPVVIYIILTSTGATALAAFIASMCGLMFAKLKGIWKFPISVLSFCVLSILGLRFMPDLLNSSGRFPMQKLLLKHFWNDFNVWFGAGPGSFPVWSSLYYKAHEYTDDGLWAWAHSDLLQVLFEYGIVGLLLSIWIFLDALHGSYKKDARLFAALLGYIVTALNYYPCHFPISSVLGMLFVSQALRKSLQNSSTIGI